jgi:hypothetical protein
MPSQSTYWNLNRYFILKIIPKHTCDPLPIKSITMEKTANSEVSLGAESGL